MLHARTKACRFSKTVSQKIRERDVGCIFCRMGYHIQYPPMPATDIMHIVNRSQGGLGVEENGALGCRYHHEMLDNGNKGRRAEMLEIISKYMRGLYPGWDAKNLVYKKSYGL